MATTTVTLIGDVSNLITEDYDPSRTKVWVEHNTDKVVTDDASPIRLGAATKNVAADGTFSFANVVASTALVTNLQATVWVDYPNAAGPASPRKRTSFGPYDLSAESGTVDIKDLEAVQALDPVYSSVLMAQMQALLAAQAAIAGIDDTDSAVAALIENALVGPLTSAALSASIDGRTPFVELGIQAGVDPTGAAECAAAINTALAAALALGARVHAKGTFKIASTVTIAGNADLGDATFNYTAAAGTAVLIGTATSGSYVEGLRVTAPKIIATAKTVTGWAQVAGTIGLDLSNLYACTIEVPLVRSFETGMRNYGKGKGNVHNTVLIGHLDNNKINQLCSASATGWSNQNMYVGGQLSHNSAEGTAVAGTRHIEMGVTANPINTNIWINASLEGDTAEFHAIVAGSYNVLDSCRWESTGGGRVKWASDSTRNEIRGGYDAESIDETFAGGAGAGNVIYSGLRAYIARAGGVTGVQILENASSSANPADIVMEAGARGAAANPASAYAVSRSAQVTGMKRASDTYDRLQLDHVNGRVYFGTGAATPAISFQMVGSAGVGLVGASLYFSADNANDIGLDATTLRPRDLFLGRNAVIGGALDHNGTTVGFYGTTPATKPTVTGSRGGNAALASLLTALASQGLIVDSSSA